MILKLNWNYFYKKFSRNWNWNDFENWNNTTSRPTSKIRRAFPEVRVVIPIKFIKWEGHELRNIGDFKSDIKSPYLINGARWPSLLLITNRKSHKPFQFTQNQWHWTTLKPQNKGFEVDCSMPRLTYGFANQKLTSPRVNLAHIIRRQILLWNEAARVNPGNSTSCELTSWSTLTQAWNSRLLKIFLRLYRLRRTYQR